MAEKLKVTQSTKASGQVGADNFEAKVTGEKAGSQSAGGSCPDCGGNHNAGKGRKAG